MNKTTKTRNVPAEAYLIKYIKNQSRVISQKENENSPSTKLKIIEDWDLIDKHFKIAVMKKLKIKENSERQFNELRNRINEQKEHFVKEIEILK